MRTSLTVLALCAVPALGLAACGGSSGSGGGSTSSQGAGSGTSSTGAAAPASPQAALDAAAAAVARTKGYHLEGTSVDASGRGGFSGDFRQDGSFSLTIRQQGTTATVRTVKGSTYFKADRAFWRQHGGKAAAGLLAGRWVAGAGDQFDPRSFVFFRPKELARCLRIDHGTVRDRGEQTQLGRRVRVIEDLGDKPGSARGLASLAADGAPLLLRIQQQGHNKPGGRRDVRCDGPDDGKPDTTRSEDLRFSDYDASTPIPVPQDALDLKALQGSGGAAAKS